jgi:hypothetical protein
VREHTEPDHGGAGDPRRGCLFALAVNVAVAVLLISLTRC